MASDCQTSNGSDEPRLAEIFNSVWNVWEYVENTNDPSVSDAFQKRVKEGVAAAETAVTMVNHLRLFTDNEDLEEVASNEIKYMLLPALLGHLQLKVTSDDRKHIINKARLFYTDFLHICKNYNVTQVDIPVIPSPDDPAKQEKKPPSHNAARPGAADLVAMNAKRQQKIDRFKHQKETEKRLQELKPLVDKDHVDDEVKRDYYETLLRRWISTSLEELEAMPDELEILEHMARMKNAGSAAPKPASLPSNKSGFRPFILTKSTLQQKVFGAGYPSLPTYTIEEFFDQQMALGNIPQPGSVPSGTPEASGEEAAAEERDEEKERKVEADDEEMLRKARNWDDWTDDHRRGWGNTQNKG